VHPAFITDGNTRDKIYMSAFEGNISSSVMRSVSGVQPAGTITIETSRTAAQARGTGWQIQTYRAIQAIQTLYLIEYADFDTQTTIGRGVVDMQSGSGNLSQDTGRTIPLGNASGKIEVTSLDRGSFASGFSKVEHISYRGVENWYGNINKWVDGLNIDDNEAYIANDSFESDKFTSPYVLEGTLANTDGFVTNILFPEFLATAVGGSSTSHLHDNYSQNTGNRVALFGGDWTRELIAGGFNWFVNVGSISGFRTNGSRIQIL
jgi:hypothetical protein